MDELLVEVCRSGKLGLLVFGMSSAEVVERIGEPRKIRNGHGDDCFQRYDYGQLELSFRCFNRDSTTRRGAGRDLVFVALTIELRGRRPVILPEAIIRDPVAAGGSLRLADARQLLSERSVEMTDDDEHMLKRSLDEAAVHLISDGRGFVSHLRVGWRPMPGGWYYSEENETGIWVTGPA